MHKVSESRLIAKNKKGNIFNTAVLPDATVSMVFTVEPCSQKVRKLNKCHGVFLCDLLLRSASKTCDRCNVLSTSCFSISFQTFTVFLF
jgi:hypothetical protein